MRFRFLGMGLVIGCLLGSSLAVAAAGAPADRPVFPGLNKQLIAVAACREELPPAYPFREQDGRRLARLGLGDQLVTAELCVVKGDEAALRAALPALTEKDVASTKRVSWNGAPAWLVDLTFDPAAHPAPAPAREYVLVTAYQDGFLLLSFAGSTGALQAQKAAILEIATGLHFSIPGLLGEYHASLDFQDRVLARVDATVDFDWNANAPAPEVPRTRVSVRWTGVVIPKFTETYTFHTISDDGVRLWVKEQPLVNNWTEHGATEDTGTIALEAGRPADLRLEWFQNQGGACIRLLWSSPSQPREIIPQACLQNRSTPGVAVLRAPVQTSGQAEGWPELVGGVTPGDFVSTLPPELTWQGRPPQQQLALGQGDRTVQVELRLEQGAGVSDVPGLAPATVAADAVKLTAVQWKDAPAWKAEFRFDPQAHPDLKLRYQKNYICPTRSGVLIVALKAPAAETVEQQQEALRRVLAGIRFTDKVREIPAFAE